MSYRGSMLLINDGKENEINWNKDKEREREREKIMTKRYVSMHTFVWIAFYKIYSVKSRLTFGYHFVNVVSAIWNGCVEASFPVGVVVDGANVAIGLNQRILTTHNITVAFFFLMFHIAGVWIVNAVFEGVSGMEILQGEQKSVMMTHFFFFFVFFAYVFLMVLILNSLYQATANGFHNTDWWCGNGWDATGNMRHGSSITETTFYELIFCPMIYVEGESRHCVLTVGQIQLRKDVREVWMLPNRQSVHRQPMD